MMKIIEKVWKYYMNEIYIDHKDERGFTKLKNFLDSLYFNKFRNGNYFSYTYKGVRIDVWKKKHLTPLLSERVLDGYLKKYEIEEGDLIVDAGAYPGEFSIYALKKGAKVISIDPNEKRADMLKENFHLNELPNFKIIKKYLGKDISLDGLREEHGKIDFIKMDIDGWEIKALMGAKEVMKDGTDFAIASYHMPARLKGQWARRDDVKNLPTKIKVEEILKKNNYDVETGHKIHQTTWGVK